MIEVGQKINSWEYIGEPENGKKRYGRFRCDCGAEKDVLITTVITGKSKSCGHCNANKLGISQNEYKKIGCARQRAITRCYNPNYFEAHRYAGRNITVCKEWLESGFAFAEWAVKNGWEDGLSLDRIDNDKGYYPENCRWANPKQQARNRSDCIFLEHNGVKKTMMEWCEEFGIPHGLPNNRWHRGERNFDALFSLIDKRTGAMLHYRP